MRKNYKIERPSAMVKFPDRVWEENGMKWTSRPADYSERQRRRELAKGLGFIVVNEDQHDEQH